MIQITVPPFLIGPVSQPKELDSRFCPICLNLSPDTANSQYSRFGVWRREETGPDDDAGWGIASSLHDICEKASAGCSSCKILKQALKSHATEKYANMNIRIYILFRGTDALRLFVCEVSNDDLEGEGYTLCLKDCLTGRVDSGL